MLRFKLETAVEKRKEAASRLDDDIKQEIEIAALMVEKMWEEYEMKFGHRGAASSEEEANFRDPIIKITTVRIFRAMDEQLRRLNLPLSRKPGSWDTHYRGGNVGLEPAPWEKSNKEHPIPTEINLHRKSRLLSIAFDDGSRFELPCEYLRVHSPAAEVKAMGQPVVGKEEVNIERIEPQGHYALRLVFDDGHDTGIYSWETLHELGVDYEANWGRYLEQLQARS